MGLETATYPNNLNANWPLGTDPKAQGDDHLRLLKKVVKAVFPAGWDDANIETLIDRAMAAHMPTIANVTGSAADLTTTKAVIATGSNFTPTGKRMFGVLTGRAGVTSLANGTATTVQLFAQLYNVTDAVQVGETWDVAVFHNTGAAAVTVNNVMKFATTVTFSLDPAKSYHIKLLAFKSATNPVTPLGDISFIGHCLT